MLYMNFPMALRLLLVGQTTICIANCEHKEYSTVVNSMFKGTELKTKARIGILSSLARALACAIGRANRSRNISSVSVV